ncbi:MAG TPA: FecR domain-containing protein [Puia sp.]|nr:FecR domain-containing protein [Puia sp.]
MREFNINQLLKLYEEGKATEEQRQLVEAYLAYHQQQSPKKLPDANPDEAPLHEIMEKIRLARELAREQQPEEAKEAPVYQIGDFATGQAGQAEEAGQANAGKRRRIAWMAAASIALIITAGLLWRQSPRKATPEAIATVYKTVTAEPGKMIHLRLSDSSEVWLNAGATIRYPQPFDNKLRKVELLDGEAFFQVHTDASRGFVVQTDRLQTRVLGTSFNIKAYRESQQMSVTVTSGKVAVTARRPDTDTATQKGTETAAQKTAETILTANQQVRYTPATGQLTRSTATSGRDWKNGQFDFSEESLGDIAIELEHYYDVHIQFKYPGLKKYLISASFRHTTPLKDMLATLCLLNQNHFIQIDPQHYVIR